MVGSEKMDKKPDMVYVCAGGIERTMNEVEGLTEQGIATSIIKIKKKMKKYTSMKDDDWIGGFWRPPRRVFPRRFTGGGWTE